MSSFIITIDLDWACEPAIEETLDFFEERGVYPTLFITHRSPRVEAGMKMLEVGLHPFFDPQSSHGSTIEETVAHVMNLPHNLPAYRCHRFGVCNESTQAMKDAGMKLSSNVCTDLEVIPPFRNRFGMLEVPVFMEDGGYLFQKHSLDIHQKLIDAASLPGMKVLLIHPMHFALNTPDFVYMKKIKRSMNRKEWNCMSKNTLNSLKWKGRGIRNLVIELLHLQHPIRGLRDLLEGQKVLHNPQKYLLESQN